MTTYTEKKFKGLLLKRQLPKGSITVNGSLGLGNCTGLTALPDNLTVNGSLDLWNCTGLKSFYTAKVSGDILFEVSLIARIPHEELIKHLGLSPEIDALIAKRFK